MASHSPRKLTPRSSPPPLRPVCLPDLVRERIRHAHYRGATGKSGLP